MSLLLLGLFSSCIKWRLLSSCGAWTSRCGNFSCCRAWALGHLVFSSCGSQALKHRLSSCGPQALLLHGMWNLPRSGIEFMSPALAGRFLTTEPPGKPSFLVPLDEGHRASVTVWGGVDTWSCGGTFSETWCIIWYLSHAVFRHLGQVNFFQVRFLYIRALLNEWGPAQCECQPYTWFKWNQFSPHSKFLWGRNQMISLAGSL